MFDQLSDLGQRKRSHSPDGPLQASKANHSKRIHTDENSFPCDSCTKLFGTASELTKHEETHRAEKPVKCEPSKKTIYLLSYVEKAGDKSLQPVIPLKDPHSPQPKQWTVIKGQCVPLKHQENMGASSTAVKLEINRHAVNRDASSKAVKQEINGDANSVDVKLEVNGDAGSKVLKNETNERKK